MSVASVMVLAPSMNVDVQTFQKAIATATATSSMNVEFVVVTASQLETAIVTETSSMPLENVEVLVRPMRTLTASATTSTHVSESLTLVACATDQEPSTSVDVQTSLKEIATATETS